MKEVTQAVKGYLKEIFSNEFFVGLRKAQPSQPEHWHMFLYNKFSGVAYFEDFLSRGINCAFSAGAQDLHYVFINNLHDEMGVCANNREPRDDELPSYRHDVWRKRSLVSFGIDPKQIPIGGLLSEAHNAAMLKAASSDNHLELAGMLLFLEIFVVREMHELIKAFERTLPGLFPGDYLPIRSPAHVQEYWYNHRDHDVRHYQEVREAIGRILEQSPRPHQDEASVLMGAKVAYEAKKLFYTPEMLATIGGKE